MRTEQVNLTGDGEPERIGAVRVSAQFFDVLGVQPSSAGRSRRATKNASGSCSSAHGLWQRRFASDPAVSGRVMLLNGEPATVVGVLPPWFRFPGRRRAARGVRVLAEPRRLEPRRAQPRAAPQPGRQELRAHRAAEAGRERHRRPRTIWRRSRRTSRASRRETNAGWTVRVISLREQLVGSVRPALLVLLTAVGFVLLIACANVANLLLVRAAARQREVCVRFALGAPRSTLVLQMLIESLVLSTLAGAAGLVDRVLDAARAPPDAAVHPAGAGPGRPRLARVRLHRRRLARDRAGVRRCFPPCTARGNDTAEGLREGARGTIGGRRAHRTRNALVVIEVALAAMLLIGSVLLIQTFLRLTRVQTGFRSDGILTMEIALPQARVPAAARVSLLRDALDRLSTLPGVEEAGVTSGLPLSGRENLALVTVEGRPRAEPGQEIISDYRVVTPGYFRVLGIPLVDGSPLPDQPRPDGPRLILINEMMARTWWPAQSPLGRRLKMAPYEQDAPWHTITGVVGDTRYTGLDSALRPQVYVHHVQDPSEQMAVVLRTAAIPRRLPCPREPPSARSTRISRSRACARWSRCGPPRSPAGAFTCFSSACLRRWR